MEEEYEPYPSEEEMSNPPLIAREPPAEYGVRMPIHYTYTYADYLSWMDEKRREIINGVVYDLFGAPTRFHAAISTNLSFFFKWFIRKRKGKCKIYHAPFDVRIPRNGERADNKIYTVVQPDICVICDPDKLDDRGCIGAPDLIVEVQSPSTAKKDMNEKFYLYESAGVKEYWMVCPIEKVVTVFLLQDGGRYDTGTIYEYDAQVPVSIFKGLKIDLKELFGD